MTKKTEELFDNSETKIYPMLPINWGQTQWEDLFNGNENNTNISVYICTIEEQLRELWEEYKWTTTNFSLKNLKKPGIYKENTEEKDMKVFSIILDEPALFKQDVKKALEKINKRFGENLLLVNSTWLRETKKGKAFAKHLEEK